VLLFAAGCGAVAVLLRQPLIVAFIAVGIVAGPAGLNWVHAAEQVDLLAKMGIALLLFVVGLKLDVHLIRNMGRVALATGFGQVLFTSVVGFGLCLLLGLEPIPALYVVVALTFSSTIIIVKLLSDKREIDPLHGRIEAPTLGLITLVGLVTIGVSTYMILYSHWLYDQLSPWLRVFERRIAHREGPDAEYPSENRRADIIVFGLGRYGGRIAEGLRAKGRAVFGVDFDPQAVAEAERNGLRACYGAAEDS